MPCNSDYMEASGKEIALSQVACLLDELNGKQEIDSSHWYGYHPKVYNQHTNGDALVYELCDRLQKEDISKRSLEMQIWWRDHQKEDKDRLERELREQKTEAEKAAALEKLTPYERKLLGV
jgi:hypothetical protein